MMEVKYWATQTPLRPFFTLISTDWIYVKPPAPCFSFCVTSAHQYTVLSPVMGDLHVWESVASAVLWSHISTFTLYSSVFTSSPPFPWAWVLLSDALPSGRNRQRARREHMSGVWTGSVFTVHKLNHFAQEWKVLHWRCELQTVPWGLGLTFKLNWGSINVTAHRNVALWNLLENASTQGCLYSMNSNENSEAHLLFFPQKSK